MPSRRALRVQDTLKQRVLVRARDGDGDASVGTPGRLSLRLIFAGMTALQASPRCRMATTAATLQVLSHAIRTGSTTRRPTQPDHPNPRARHLLPPPRFDDPSMFELLRYPRATRRRWRSSCRTSTTTAPTPRLNAGYWRRRHATAVDPREQRHRSRATRVCAIVDARAAVCDSTPQRWRHL